MNKPRFSKSPWSIWSSHHELADTGDYYDEIGIMANDRQICVLCGDDDDEVRANANLMVKCPEMYDMLERCCAYLCATTNYSLHHDVKKLLEKIENGRN